MTANIPCEHNEIKKNITYQPLLLIPYFCFQNTKKNESYRLESCQVL